MDAEEGHYICMHPRVPAVDFLLAGTEARPTNLKIETRNFSRQFLMGLWPTRKT
jgi:hypothetical protein